MERIDLYDKYINDQLSKKERADFDAQLESDKDFASDFKMYLFTVDGICREAHQDNLDFGLALKGLSKDQLKELIGKQDVEQQAAASIAESPRIERPKVLRFKPWMWQAASIAAVVIIAITVVLHIEKSARYSVDNAIYACAQLEDVQTRDASGSIDITKLNEKQLETKLPELEKNYKGSIDNNELYLNGYPLAMAYIRLHRPEPAVKILNTLVNKLQNEEDYDFEVREMRLIISLLE